jgi:hypothetical protein
MDQIVFLVLLQQMVELEDQELDLVVLGLVQEDMVEVVVLEQLED